jgi:hypothetical protein
MALILLGSERFATFWTSEENNTMPHDNTVFHQLLKLVPWSEFERLVEKHGTDKHVRKLSTKSQFVALLYAQVSGASSLREIEAGLESHALRLYHAGSTPVARSTIADANRLRSSEVFSKFFAVLLKQAHRGLRRKLGEAVYLVDATSLALNEHSADWAQFSADVCAAKLHVVYDPDADRPVYFSTTAGKVNDITAAQKMPITPAATYVFDLGYYDFRWWAKLNDAGCRIVTRLKKNTRLEVIEEHPLLEGGPILYDKIGYLPERLSYVRKNPLQIPMREIGVVTDTGKQLRITTNDLDTPAEEIANLYKKRWQIELFFRWIKQVLKIRHFFGTSQNAIQIQIAVALIAFLLLRMAQSLQTPIKSPMAFARLVRANLMLRRRLDRLIEPEPGRPANPNQLAIQWA